MRIDIVLAKREAVQRQWSAKVSLTYIARSKLYAHRNKVCSVPNGNLYEAQPFPQRQVRSAWTCAQTFACASDDDCNSVALAFPQDPFTAPTAYAAQAQGHQDVTVDGDLEVGIEREQMRGDAWERRRKLRRRSGKVGDRAHAYDAVRMVAKDVVAIGRQISAFDE